MMPYYLLLVFFYGIKTKTKTRGAGGREKDPDVEPAGWRRGGASCRGRQETEGAADSRLIDRLTD